MTAKTNDGGLIHPTAIIEPGAVLGEGTQVGPYSVIGPNVTIGRNNRILSHVVIEGQTTIGNDNVIFQFASVGAQPQDLKYRGEPSRLEIGDGNIIREYVTLQPGTQGGGMLTKIGQDNLFMACCHIGHDSIVGSGNVIANGAAIAGHVTIGNNITVGGLSGIHQFVRLGDLCFLGAGSMVAQDIPPFCMAQGDHARLVGLNSIGLERKGFKSDEITRLRSVYRSVFMGAGTFRERLKGVSDSIGDSRLVEQFLNFVNSSQRGIALPRKGENTDRGYR